jgi:hypothetical protein
MTTVRYNVSCAQAATSGSYCVIVITQMRPGAITLQYCLAVGTNENSSVVLEYIEQGIQHTEALGTSRVCSFSLMLRASVSLVSHNSSATQPASQ